MSEALNRKKIVCVCRDPGGAQALMFLSSRLKRRGYDVITIARGPALSFADRSGVDVCKDGMGYGAYGRIRKFLRRMSPGVIITGTSIQDDLERMYMRAGRSLNIPVIAMVDWWTGFENRFTFFRTGERVIPDKICVIDEAAGISCRRHFKNKAAVIVTGNPYFDSIRPAKSGSTGKRSLCKRLKLPYTDLTILFLAEPTEPPVGYDQFEIFKRVAGELAKISRAHKKGVNVIIKFHPNGERENIYRKYAKIVGDNENEFLRVRFVKKQYNVGELIDGSDLVWGMNTTPLLEAMFRGRLVSSFLHDVDIPGIPFLKKAFYCPSADSYAQFPLLIRRLLTDRQFVRKSRGNQKRYMMKGRYFFKVMDKLIKSETVKRWIDGKSARD